MITICRGRLTSSVRSTGNHQPWSWTVVAGVTDKADNLNPYELRFILRALRTFGLIAGIHDHTWNMKQLREGFHLTPHVSKLASSRFPSHTFYSGNGCRCCNCYFGIAPRAKVLKIAAWFLTNWRSPGIKQSPVPPLIKSLSGNQVSAWCLVLAIWKRSGPLSLPPNILKVVPSVLAPSAADSRTSATVSRGK